MYIVKWALILSLLACSGSTVRIATLSETELTTVPIDRLAITYYYYSDNMAVKNELIRRAVISSREWGLISNNDICIGMSKCALLASKGPALQINTIESLEGNTLQYVYRLPFSTIISPYYVYLKDDRVVSIQR